MKAISLLQPWATLVAIGEKQIETRSWSTKYRGQLAIHASAGKQFINMKSKDYLCGTEPFYSVIMEYANKRQKTYKDIADMLSRPVFQRGAIIATCELTNCVKIPDQPTLFQSDDRIDKSYGQKFNLVPPISIFGHEYAFGDYTPGRYAWILSNIKMLEKPIPAKGKLGLWDWEGGE